jgi:membrane associated rhomboid family serine protease
VISPHRQYPFTTALLLVHGGVGALLLASGQAETDRWVHWYGDGLSSWTWLRSVFVHADAGHLAGDLLWLGICGCLLEPALGVRRFAGLYFSMVVLQGFCEEALGTQTDLLGAGAFGASAINHGLLGLALVTQGRTPLTTFPGRRVYQLLIGLYAVDLVIGWQEPGPLASELTHLLGLILGACLGWVHLRLTAAQPDVIAGRSQLQI